ERRHDVRTRPEQDRKKHDRNREPSGQRERKYRPGRGGARPVVGRKRLNKIVGAHGLYFRLCVERCNKANGGHDRSPNLAYSAASPRWSATRTAPSLMVSRVAASPMVAPSIAIARITARWRSGKASTWRSTSCCGGPAGASS